MTGRLPSHLLVSALLRRVEGAGGFATVIRKGDASGGVILVQLLQHGTHLALLERITDLDDRQTLVPCGPSQPKQDIEIQDYIEKRRRADPDLWLIELDVAEGERLAAETLCAS